MEALFWIKFTENKNNKTTCIKKVGLKFVKQIDESEQSYLYSKATISVHINVNSLQDDKELLWAL